MMYAGSLPDDIIQIIPPTRTSSAGSRRRLRLLQKIRRLREELAQPVQPSS